MDKRQLAGHNLGWHLTPGACIIKIITAVIYGFA
jgi:hypothetical protein